MAGEQGMKSAKFSIGQLVKHRIFPFRGVIFDVDPEFANDSGEPVRHPQVDEVFVRTPEGNYRTRDRMRH